MLATILGFLSHYPNFLRQVDSQAWALCACFCFWQCVISWAVYRQTGLRSYVGATVGLALMTAGAATAPVARNLLELVMMPAPLLVAGFMVLSLSDARSWFTAEAADKYYLIKYGGLRLRFQGLVPRDFVPGQRPHAVTWLQGVLMGGVTLGMITLIFFGARHAHEVGAISQRALVVASLAMALAAFESLALVCFALIYGAPLRRRQPPAGTEASPPASA
ncbi:MAG TPA: hypothetical protein VGM19_12820 [Armatimonadota bacterium]|jgi:hypothetical protein